MIERYVWRIILPYFLLAWVLLTTILFIQQGSRFTEIIFGLNLPWRIWFELGAALVVSVIAFTGPMALLAGIVIGLGQMRGDSEITALQAAGYGSRRILVPCLLTGCLVSGIALLINLEGVPAAARVVRKVAAETALLKLKSPIEPGVFNTEFNDYVIYVKEGNNEEGVWERIFIYFPQRNGQIRLITARSGRIDAANEKSELVLSDAVVTSLAETQTGPPQPITRESIFSLRFSLDTGRKKILEKLASVERVPDEMGLAELSAVVAAKNGRERIEAEILWHRRLALSLAPLFLSLLGVAVSLRFGRGGRGWGSLLSLVVLIFYYLLSLLGEQSVRAGWLPAWAGGWLATSLIILVTARWLRQGRRRGKRHWRLIVPVWFKFPARQIRMINPLTSRLNFGKFFQDGYESGIFGLLERDLLQNLVRYFLLTCFALLALFHVFTVFEVLRALTTNANGGILLARYLLLLSPLVLSQIAPTAFMLAVLVTYAVKARQRETVIWAAAGQSIYVLIFPALILAVVIGCLSWEWQERLLPSTNPRQDVLRAQLRSGTGSVGSQEGRFWVAAPEGIYTFLKSNASDNGKGGSVSFYQFFADGVHLQKAVHAEAGKWRDSSVNFAGPVSEIIWRNSFVETRIIPEGAVSVASPENPFGQVSPKVSHLSSQDLAKLIQTAESPLEVRRLSVALQRRYATLLLPLVIVFFIFPMALAGSGKRGRSLGFSLGATVAVWLLFLGISGLFERLGIEGVLPPLIAVWSPLVGFSGLGWYLLSKTHH